MSTKTELSKQQKKITGNKGKNLSGSEEDSSEEWIRKIVDQEYL